MRLPELLSPMAIILKSQLLPPGIILSHIECWFDVFGGSLMLIPKGGSKLWNPLYQHNRFPTDNLWLFDCTCRNLNGLTCINGGNIF